MSIEPGKELVEVPPLEGEYLGPKPTDEEILREIEATSMMLQQLMKMAQTTPPPNEPKLTHRKRTPLQTVLTWIYNRL